MSETLTKLQQIQTILGVAADDDWGLQSEGALTLEKKAAKERRALRAGERPTSNVQHPTSNAEGKLGDGTWPWSARVEGEDVVVDHARMTCFGGSDDPQDSGETASGISTKRNPDLAAVSLPMDGRMFAGLSKAEHGALDGSPIPRVPFRTIVRVTVNGIAGSPPRSFDWPVIDLGPGKRTGNALDLTIAAARQINPKASATNFEAVGSYRVLGAAKHVAKSA